MFLKSSFLFINNKKIQNSRSSCRIKKEGLLIFVNTTVHLNLSYHVNRVEK